MLKMKVVRVSTNWDPKSDFQLGFEDIERKLTYQGSQVWRNPKLKIKEKGVPEIGPTEVLIKVKACGSDVYMAQKDEEGYILYPGLTAFPVTIGHEFSGIVAKAGNKTIDKRTGKSYGEGDAVCSEEMFWSGSCRPCVDGFPNYCGAIPGVRRNIITYRDSLRLLVVCLFMVSTRLSFSPIERRAA